MGRKAGLVNITESTNEGSVTANNVTAIVLVAANSDRISLWVGSDANKAIVVRLRAAASDNNLTGILIPAGSSPIPVLGSGDVYEGEVSVMADSPAGILVTFSELSGV